MVLSARIVTKSPKIWYARRNLRLHLFIRLETGYYTPRSNRVGWVVEVRGRLLLTWCTTLRWVESYGAVCEDPFIMATSRQREMSMLYTESIIHPLDHPPSLTMSARDAVVVDDCDGAVSLF